jgi:hypothetical protein
MRHPKSVFLAAAAAPAVVLLLLAGAASVASSACVSSIHIEGTSPPMFDVSAQSYDDDPIGVYARVDNRDPSKPSVFRATVDGHDAPLVAKDGSASVGASFTPVATAFAAVVRFNDAVVATIDVPAAFAVRDVPALVTDADKQLRVTLSAPVGPDAKVSVRVRPGGCVATLGLGENVYPATSVTADGHVTFDLAMAFEGMSQRECDQPLGVRIAAPGKAGDPSSDVTAVGLREQGVTVHLVNQRLPFATDAGANASSAGKGVSDAGGD